MDIWDNERSFSEGSYSGQALSSVEDFKIYILYIINIT
jgi:hypothetical protein